MTQAKIFDAFNGRISKTVIQQKIFKKFRFWICDHTCPDRIFNEDMSLEVDRLTAESEELKEKLNQLETGNVL